MHQDRPARQVPNIVDPIARQIEAHSNSAGPRDESTELTARTATAYAPLSRGTEDALRSFLSTTRFSTEGAIITDLDGTAILEREGQVLIPDPVSHGLKALTDQGRPVILNSLRFPLNVIRTFGREWYAITNAPLPLVSLNGGITGYLKTSGADEVVFEEITAFPLTAPEIDELLEGVRGLLDEGITELIVFHYPRDWREGEIIWTPQADRIESLRAKYLSASQVMTSSVDDLRTLMIEGEACMVLLLVDAPEDRLMAYQHAKRSNFVNHKGIDKLTGLTRLADQLGLDLAHAVGAGDTPMDTFLRGVGLAVQVGPLPLEYHGLSGTVRVKDSLELGALLFHLAELQGGVRS